MMKKKVFGLASGIITILCFLFVANSIYKVRDQWIVVFSKPISIIIILILTCFFSASLYLVALAWEQILLFIQEKSLKKGTLAKVYVKSNIAKYLPGNIMNLVGRNVLAGNLGFDQSKIAFSTLMEIGLFACTTLLWAVLFSLKQIGKIASICLKYLNIKFLLLVFGLGMILLSITIAILYLKRDSINNFKKIWSKRFVQVCIKSVVQYSVFFLYSGLMLVLILIYILGIELDIISGIQIIGFYIVSYFVGYITPGAPGGMGVRETVLMILLSSFMGNESGIVASIIHRIITIFADVGIYLFIVTCEKISEKKSK